MIALDRAKLPFPSHYQRFTIATFALLEAGSQRALRGPVRIPVLRCLLPPKWDKPSLIPPAPCELMQRFPDGLGFTKCCGGQ